VTRDLDPAVAAMRGPAAPPRRNGELVFDAPWQGRAFGLAVVMVRRLGLPWSAFQQHLIAAIAARPEAPYYECWVTAMEQFAIEHGAATAAELDAFLDRVRHAAADATPTS
jgi:nitrile hydratase accessory protein